MKIELKKVMKIVAKKQGGHYHCRVFTGKFNHTFAKVGDIVLDEDDVQAYLRGELRPVMEFEEVAQPND